MVPPAPNRPLNSTEYAECPSTGQPCIQAERIKAQGDRIQALERTTVQQASQIELLKDGHQDHEAHMGKIDGALVELIAELQVHAQRIGSAGDGLPDGKPPSGLVGMLLSVRSDNERLMSQLNQQIRPKLDSLVEELEDEAERTAIMSREQLVERAHKAEEKLETLQQSVEAARQKAADEERAANAAWRAKIVKALILIAVGAAGGFGINDLWAVVKVLLKL